LKSQCFYVKKVDKLPEGAPPGVNTIDKFGGVSVRWLADDAFAFVRKLAGWPVHV
jgi:hypothetical protein